MQFTHLLSRTGRDIFAKKLNCVSNTRNPCGLSFRGLLFQCTVLTKFMPAVFVHWSQELFDVSFVLISLCSRAFLNLFQCTYKIYANCICSIVMGTLLSITFRRSVLWSVRCVPCIPQPQTTTTTTKRRTRTHTRHSTDKIWSKIAYRSCYLRVLHNIRNPNSKTSANRDLNE